MGWNQLTVQKPSPLFKDLVEGSGVYFVHSYHVVPDDQSIIAVDDGLRQAVRQQRLARQYRGYSVSPGEESEGWTSNPREL